MRFLKIVSNILGFIFLLTPIYLYFHPYSEHCAPIGNQISEDLYLKDFQYSHWIYKGSQTEKDFILSGKILSDQNKRFGPWQFGFIKELIIQDPHVDFYKDGLNYAQLIAGHGVPQLKLALIKEGFFNTDTIIFSQNPVLTGINGHVFNCNTMVWQRNSGTLNGQGDCRLQLENQRIFAPAISVDQNLLTWHIPGNVT